MDGPFGGIDCSDSEISRYQQDDHVESYTTCYLLSEGRLNRLTKLTPSQCMQRYKMKVETGGYNLIAVTKDIVVSPATSFAAANASAPVLAYFESMTYSSALASWCTSACKNWCTSSDCDTWCLDSGWNSSNTSSSCYQYVRQPQSWHSTDLTGPSDWPCQPDYAQHLLPKRMPQSGRSSQNSMK